MKDIRITILTVWMQISSHDRHWWTEPSYICCRKGQRSSPSLLPGWHVAQIAQMFLSPWSDVSPWGEALTVAGAYKHWMWDQAGYQTLLQSPGDEIPFSFQLSQNADALSRPLVTAMHKVPSNDWTGHRGLSVNSNLNPFSPFSGTRTNLILWVCAETWQTSSMALT